MDTVINVIFPFLTVVIGAACIFMFISTKTLRDSRDDQEKRIKFLEEQHDRDDAKNVEQAAQIEALRKVVTGEVHLVAITDLVEHVSKDLNFHHDAATTQWTAVRATLEHIDLTMTTLSTQLDRDEK